MQFGIVENGTARAASPRQIEAHVAQVKGDGRSYTYAALVRWPLADLIALGIYPIRSEYTAPGPYQYQAGETYTLEGQEIVRRTVLADFTLEQAKAKATADMAAKRWEVETSGILWTRPSDGRVFGISTDPTSQSKINSEADAAGRGLRDPALDVWKCLDAATGAVVFVPMENADIVDMATKARAHVAAAFRREGEVVALIQAAATVAAVAAVKW